MADRKSWLEVIEALDSWQHESMLLATQHTFLKEPLPDELAFLNGRFVIFGFENLGLDPQKLTAILRAFCSTGVAIPETKWRLRFVYMHTVVEPLDGHEKGMLPLYWKEGVTACNKEFPTWIGKRVPIRPEWRAEIDFSKYRDTGEAWVRS